MKIYGVNELAEATGIPRGTVSLWLHRGKLPKPTTELAMGKLWTGVEIEKWIKETKAKNLGLEAVESDFPIGPDSEIRTGRP